MAAKVIVSQNMGPLAAPVTDISTQARCGQSIERQECLVQLVKPHTEAYAGWKLNSLPCTHPSRRSTMRWKLPGGRYPAPFNLVALSSSPAAVPVWSKMPAPVPAITFALQLVRKGTMKGGAPSLRSCWPGPHPRAHGTAREAGKCSPLYPTNTSVTMGGRRDI